MTLAKAASDVIAKYALFHVGLMERILSNTVFIT